MAPSAGTDTAANITQCPARSGPPHVAGHLRTCERDRRDAGHQRKFARAAAPGVVAPRQFQEDREPRDAGYRDEVDLDPAQQLRRTDQPDSVQGHHDSEAGQTDGGQHEHDFAGVAG